MTDRTPRDQETREKTSRKKVWQRPSVLPEPVPRKGLVHRWVRVSTLGQPDVRNVAGKRREGWEPARAKDYPEFKDFLDDGVENIEIGGLMLCVTDKEIMDQRQEYYKNLSQQQLQSVDSNYMRQNDERSSMQLLPPERRSKTTWGTGQPDG